MNPELQPAIPVMTETVPAKAPVSEYNAISAVSTPQDAQRAAKKAARKLSQHPSGRDASVIHRTKLQVIKEGELYVAATTGNPAVTTDEYLKSIAAKSTRRGRRPSQYGGKKRCLHADGKILIRPTTRTPPATTS